MHPLDRHCSICNLYRCLHMLRKENEDLNRKKRNMSLIRVILAIFFPPLAVVDKGCGSFLIVFLLTLCGWAPGVIGALVIINKE